MIRPEHPFDIRPDLRKAESTTAESVIRPKQLVRDNTFYIIELQSQYLLFTLQKFTSEFESGMHGVRTLDFLVFSNKFSMLTISVCLCNSNGLHSLQYVNLVIICILGKTQIHQTLAICIKKCKAGKKTTRRVGKTKLYSRHRIHINFIFKDTSSTLCLSYTKKSH